MPCLTASSKPDKPWHYWVLHLTWHTLGDSHKNLCIINSPGCILITANVDGCYYSAVTKHFIFASSDRKGYGAFSFVWLGDRHLPRIGARQALCCRLGVQSPSQSQFWHLAALWTLKTLSTHFPSPVQKQGSDSWLSYEWVAKTKRPNLWAAMS